MKVCFVSHSSQKGGAERALIETIEALKKKGVDCYVLIPENGPFIYELRKRNIPFSKISYKRWIDWESSPLWKRLKDAIINLFMIFPIVLKMIEWQCDIVYTNTVGVSVGAIAARIIGRPHVWHIHEFFGREENDIVFHFGQNLSLKLIDKLSALCIVTSNAIAQKYKQYIMPTKVRVIYQSVTVSELRPISPDGNGFKCIIVGFLCNTKRQEDSIKAVAELVHAGLSIELYIVGGGGPEYEQHLKRMVSKAHIGDHVKFVGYVEDVYSYMKNADVVLVCSKSEAFGRVTVEGMLAGKPVIGAEKAATGELIRDGFNGLLYTLGDYKELAEKIKYLYDHRPLARQMGENGKVWANQLFSQERYGEEMLTILNSLIKRR